MVFIKLKYGRHCRKERKFNSFICCRIFCQKQNKAQNKTKGPLTIFFLFIYKKQKCDKYFFTDFKWLWTCVNSVSRCVNVTHVCTSLLLYKCCVFSSANILWVRSYTAQIFMFFLYKKDKYSPVVTNRICDISFVILIEEFSLTILLYIDHLGDK